MLWVSGKYQDGSSDSRSSGTSRDIGDIRGLLRGVGCMESVRECQGCHGV